MADVMDSIARPAGVALGIRANLNQFLLLILLAFGLAPYGFFESMDLLRPW